MENKGIKKDVEGMFSWSARQDPGHQPGNDSVSYGDTIKIGAESARRHAQAVAQSRRAKRPQPSAQRIAEEFKDGSGAQSDILGSYTGTAKDGGSPVQDADDL